MEKTQSISIIDHFASVDDPRMESTGKRQARRHHRGRRQLGRYRILRQRQNQPVQDLPRTPQRIPSHDTFGRVFSIIYARNFQDIFIEWTKTVWEAAEGQVAAIDGETVRRSADKANCKYPIHMASACATDNGVALGQVKTDDHSNEITAIPKLLKTQDSGGCEGALGS